MLAKYAIEDLTLSSPERRVCCSTAAQVQSVQVADIVF